MVNSQMHSDMFVLDCSTADDAIASLCDAFSCSRSDLEIFLLGIDLDTIYSDLDSSPDIPCDQYLYDQCVDTFGDPKEIEYIYWFHCTRTEPEEYFSDGILQLGDVLENVWEMVLRMAPDERVRNRLKEWGNADVPDNAYQLKTKDAFHWGPYAILVKEVAFYAKDLGQHDYLEIPELIEDICNAYHNKYEEIIYYHYEDVLVPKIVTFISDKRRDNGCIETALGYAYTSVRGLPPCGMAVNCIDCEGSVHPEQIINVENIDLETQA